MSRVSTPECDRAREVRPYSQRIGEFLDWLAEEKQILLATWINGSKLALARPNTERLLAEFFGLDLDRIEDEKRALLDQLRKEHKPK